MCIYMNYRALVPPPYFFQIIILYAPITSDKCHAWFHLYGLSQPEGVGVKATQKIKQNEKFLSTDTVGLELTTLRFIVRASTDWAGRDWWKLSF